MGTVLTRFLTTAGPAQIKATDEGIILKPSPPLVEPDDKRAGFTLA